MRTITVAAAMILLLTAHANSQNLNMLGGLGDKRPLSAEEAAKQKAADEAYKAAVGKIRGQCGGGADAFIPFSRPAPCPSAEIVN